MRAELRSLAVTVLGLALLPTSALGATVDRDTETGVITIVGQGVDADDITVERTSMFDIISSDGAVLDNLSSECDPPGTAGTLFCDRASSFAVDLG